RYLGRRVKLVYRRLCIRRLIGIARGRSWVQGKPGYRGSLQEPFPDTFRRLIHPRMFGRDNWRNVRLQRLNVLQECATLIALLDVLVEDLHGVTGDLAGCRERAQPFKILVHGLSMPRVPETVPAPLRCVSPGTPPRGVFPASDTARALRRSRIHVVWPRSHPRSALQSTSTPK